MKTLGRLWFFIPLAAVLAWTLFTFITMLISPEMWE